MSSSTNIFEQKTDFRRLVVERMGVEAVLGVAHELSEGSDHAPGVRAMDKNTLEQHGRSYVRELLVLDRQEQVKKEIPEPESVGVGVAQVHRERGNKTTLTYSCVSYMETYL
jgi:hypothetical protein